MDILTPSYINTPSDAGDAQNELTQSKVNIKDELDKIKSIIDLTHDMI